MTKYLATDLDGTLLYPKLKNNYMCKANIDALKVFNKNVIIVSGRNQLFAKKICNFLSIKETFIACNGAAICCEGKEIFLQHIDTAQLNELIDYVKKTYSKYTMILFDSKGNLYSICDDINRAIETEKKHLTNFPKIAYTTDKNIDTINELLSKENSIIKINVALDYDGKIELYNYLNSCNYDFTLAICNGSLEITARGINKGASLKRLTEYMKLSNDDVYVIGDDKNDLSMFNEYPNSFLINHDNNKDLHNKVKHVLDSFKDIKNYIKEDI